ncbi:hypothetical protein [Synechococcus sp. MIT S9509]|uniref:hypothetical protein n=1 Tax=Synechococcus sp. MIT S9509 TaxID=1801630 RepID=UPI0012E7EC3E|nr:hypothetical protein [Synechococcus sp. MIT S9509]
MTNEIYSSYSRYCFCWRISKAKGCDSNSQFWWAMAGATCGIIGIMLAWIYAGKNKAIFRGNLVLKSVGVVFALVIAFGDLIVDETAPKVAKSSRSVTRKRSLDGFELKTDWGSEGDNLGGCMSRAKRKLKDPDSFKYDSHYSSSDSITLKI